jgi:hypothetical protein
VFILGFYGDLVMSLAMFITETITATRYSETLATMVIS